MKKSKCTFKTGNERGGEKGKILKESKTSKERDFWICKGTFRAISLNLP
jgi:hypothetical protein